MQINPNKSKALSFMRAREKDLLHYSLGGQKILKLAVANILESSYGLIR